MMNYQRQNLKRKNKQLLVYNFISIYTKSVRTYDDEQILDLLRRTQELEKQKNVMHGVLLIVMGIALQALSYGISGSNVKDFISGLLLGLSIAEMLVGVYVVGKSMSGR